MALVQLRLISVGTHLDLQKGSLVTGRDLPDSVQLFTLGFHFRSKNNVKGEGARG